MRRREARVRGRRRKIVGEALVRVGSEKASLYEVLACGHYQRGVYNTDGDSCNAGTQTPVVYRICRKCVTGEPQGAPGEIVVP